MKGTLKGKRPAIWAGFEQDELFELEKGARANRRRNRSGLAHEREDKRRMDEELASRKIY